MPVKWLRSLPRQMCSDRVTPSTPSNTRLSASTSRRSVASRSSTPGHHLLDVRVVRRVELDVVRARRGQHARVLVHQLDQVLEVGVAVGVGLVGDAVLEVVDQQRGARHRHLHQPLGARPGERELEVGQRRDAAQPLDRRRRAQLVLDARLVAVVADEAERVDPLDEHLDGREEEPAPVLAVGDDRQPDVLLEPDRLLDRAVLDRAQLVRRQAVVTRLEQVVRPQQAAEVVRADSSSLISNRGTLEEQGDGDRAGIEHPARDVADVARAPAPRRRSPRSRRRRRAPRGRPRADRLRPRPRGQRVRQAPSRRPSSCRRPRRGRAAGRSRCPRPRRAASAASPTPRRSAARASSRNHMPYSGPLVPPVSRNAPEKRLETPQPRCPPRRAAPAPAPPRPRCWSRSRRRRYGGRVRSARPPASSTAAMNASAHVRAAAASITT